METIRVRDLSFAYPGADAPALRHLDLTVPAGSFTVLCGASGCGKTTLLRLLKPLLAPEGDRSGEILFEGRPAETLSLREQASCIGFVQQHPEQQIVTDKVWHELAFGLESLGLEQAVIRRRVAEMVSFFGIADWFHRNTADLSGGQKQILNLASALALQPRLLVLDEPTSQLDPIAASDFIALLGRVSRELGVTILLSEHRLEDAIPLADQLLVMEKGGIAACGSPSRAGEQLRAAGNGMYDALPAAMRIWSAVPGDLACPVTVRDGRAWLEAVLPSDRPVLPAEQTRRVPLSGQKVCLEAEGLYYRYEQDAPDVLNNTSICLHAGRITAILGSNGSGKSTLLQVLAGVRKQQRGSVTADGRVSLLPQDPQLLFSRDTVRAELEETASSEEDLQQIARACLLTGLMDRHPYDLSGGEQQRAALAKLLLLRPDVLLLDEPTKGLDVMFRHQLAALLRKLCRAGTAVLMVSHDVDFCAENCDRCALFFDGGLTADGTPEDFFSGNHFYTTAASRMVRNRFPEVVTVPAAADAVRRSLGLPPLTSVQEDDPEDTAPEPALPASAAPVSAKRPLWRRILACVAAAGVIGSLFGAALVSGRAGSDLTLTQELPWAAAVLVSFLLLSAAAGRGERRRVPTSGREAVPKRTLLAAACLLVLVPLTILFGLKVLAGRKYYFISLLILLECMVPFYMSFEGRKPKAKELTVMAALCAINVAGRAAFFMLPSFKPVIAITILAGVAYGAESGFLVGSVTMLVSNILFSQGPWTPYQMFAMGLIGFLAGLLFRRHRPGKLLLSAFGALSAIVIYGGLLNPVGAFLFGQSPDTGMILAYYISGFPVDCVQAAATFLMLWLLTDPVLDRLDRLRIRYGIMKQASCSP